MGSYGENLEAEARSFPFYPNGTTVSERITLLERNTALFKKEEAFRNRSCLEKTVEKITPFAADVFAACFCAAVSFVDPSYALFAEVVYTANLFLTE
jgi:hypothetical protein